MQDTLRRFASAIHDKFASTLTGEPEDQLRSPFEQLLSDCGVQFGHPVLAIGETLLRDGGGRPDFGVSVGGLLCGHVELKAPGKGADPATFRGHDKHQWQRFQNLPNLLYCDGREFGLYRLGGKVRFASLHLDPRSAGPAAVSTEDAAAVDAILRDFLQWEPIVPSSAKQLAEFLAPLTRLLRDDVLDALRHKNEAVMAAAGDWRRYLFPGADDAHFADAYAQTVTFTLLLARSNGADTLFLDTAITALTHANTLLARALKVLTDPLVQTHLGASLGLLQRVIAKVPTGTMSGGRRDPWLHFYEDFLEEYDPDLRKDAGAYYTPVEVVQAQVRIADTLLRERMNRPYGLASGGVNVLDPAVGTGTYLLGIAEHALESVREQEGEGAVAARAGLLANNLYGFEIMVGPYAVAALRLTRLLQQAGTDLPGDGVQIMLNNTLESPHEKIPELPLMYRPIGLEHRRAKRVKETVPILLCIGNPPYDRHAAATHENRAMTGGWVRWGEDGAGHPILDDFIDPVKAAGKGGDLKNLYNLYVYFWRWALWKTFEHDLANGPGIVSFISASSFLDGAAFLGMRSHMRRVCDEIWVIDLGGEGRGTRRDENVFAIQTPVAITVAVRYGAPSLGQPAAVHHIRIEGTRTGKLACLESLRSLHDLTFADCSADWAAPFRPVGSGDFFDWPLLIDLMPWQHSGIECKRTWPIAATQEVLKERWDCLLRSPIRADAFRESSDQTVTQSFGQFIDGHVDMRPIAELPPGTSFPPIEAVGFRSFDRQFIMADGRLIARPRPQLWQSHSIKQFFFATLTTDSLDTGPSLTLSATVPDRHFFCGRGGKDVLPLWRDAAATLPNLHPMLLPRLVTAYGHAVTPEDFAAYLYAVLAHPAFTARFHDELASRELRVPVTLDTTLFMRGVALGRELIFLHSFGERMVMGQHWPAPAAKCLKAVPASGLPERFAYDESQRLLHVGEGTFGPVSAAVWGYEVSGLRVLQSWLGYRMRRRKGRKSSPLDDITPSGWGAEFTSELLRLITLLDRSIQLAPAQGALLEEVVAGPLLLAEDLGVPPPEWRAAPRMKAGHVEMDGFEEAQQ